MKISIVSLILNIPTPIISSEDKTSRYEVWPASFCLYVSRAEIWKQIQKRDDLYLNDSFRGKRSILLPIDFLLSRKLPIYYVYLFIICHVFARFKNKNPFSAHSFYRSLKFLLLTFFSTTFVVLLISPRLYSSSIPGCSYNSAAL